MDCPPSKFVGCKGWLSGQGIGEHYEAISPSKFVGC